MMQWCHFPKLFLPTGEVCLPRHSSASKVFPSSRRSIVQSPTQCRPEDPDGYKKALSRFGFSQSSSLVGAVTRPLPSSASGVKMFPSAGGALKQDRHGQIMKRTLVTMTRNLLLQRHLIVLVTCLCWPILGCQPLLESSSIVPNLNDESVRPCPAPPSAKLLQSRAAKIEHNQEAR